MSIPEPAVNQRAAGTEIDLVVKLRARWSKSYWLGLFVAAISVVGALVAIIQWLTKTL